MNIEYAYYSRLQPWSDIQTQMPILLEIASGYPEVKILELGVRSCKSTAAFMLAAERTGGHVWSVDVNPPEAPEECWEPFWTFTLGNDLEVPLEDLPRPDVLFIDTDHTFDQTVAELRRFVPLVAEGGVVLMHDTLLTWDHPEYEVPRALDAFCAETGRTWEELSVPPYGLGRILHPNG